MYTKKQIHDNSCAAACLLAAGYDGLSQKAVKDKLGCPAQDTPNDVETVIYYVTCGAEARRDAFIPKAAGYSMPSSICRAAKIIGFKQVKVYRDATNPIAAGILSRYPAETAATASSGGTVVNSVYDWGAARERCLMVICWANGGLHYVYAHNGNVMDPGTGTISSAANYSNCLKNRGAVAGIFLTLQ